MTDMSFRFLMTQFFKKSLLFGTIGIVLFGIGGLGGVFFDAYLIPYLSTNRFFSRLPIVKTASEKTTIIEKTEQVIVQENDSIERIVSQPSTTVVSVIASSKNTIEKGKISNGTLLTNDGMVVTVSDALSLDRDATYTILLQGGESYPARLVGTDPFTGLSFLKIDATNVPAIAFANSDDARTGKRLVAIGISPEPYQSRYASGMLELKDRTFNLSGKTVASSEKLEGVFLVDLKNPIDYLGGPVVQWNGEMVGLLSSIPFDNGRKYFAIPANVVRDSLNRAIEGHLSDRSVLGVYYVSLTKAYAALNDLSREEGAMIYSPSGKTGLSVLSGSPADRANLHSGDIIIAVGTERVTLDQPLSVLLGKKKKGDVVSLLILRNGSEQEISVQL